MQQMLPTQSRNTPSNSPTHTHTHAPRQCVVQYYTLLFPSPVLFCNWKAGEGILGNMTT